MRHWYVLPKISHKEENIRGQWGPRKTRVCMRRAGKDLSPSDLPGLLADWFSTRMKWAGQKNQSVVRKMEMTRNSELDHITGQPCQSLVLAQIENIARIVKGFDWLLHAAKKLCQ